MTNTNKQYKSEVEGSVLLNKFEMYLIGQDKKEPAVRLAALRTNQEYDPKSMDILFGILKEDQGDAGLPTSAFNENEKLSINDFCAKNGIPFHFDINAEELDLNGIDFISFEVKKSKPVIKADEDITVIKNSYGEWVAKDAKTGKIIVPDDKPIKPSIKDTPVGKTSRVEKTTPNPHKSKNVETIKEQNVLTRDVKKFTPKEEFKMNMTLLANALGCYQHAAESMKFTTDVRLGSLHVLNNNKESILNKIRRNRTIGDYLKMNGIKFENVDIEVYIVADNLRLMFMTVKDIVIILDGNHNNADGKMNILWSNPIYPKLLIGDLVKYISVHIKNGGVEGNTNWKAMASK